MKPRLLRLTALLLAPLAGHADIMDVRPVVAEREGVPRIVYRSGETLVARPTDIAPAGVELRTTINIK